MFRIPMKRPSTFSIILITHWFHWYSFDSFLCVCLRCKNIDIHPYTHIHNIQYVINIFRIFRLAKYVLTTFTVKSDWRREREEEKKAFSRAFYAMRFPQKLRLHYQWTVNGKLGMLFENLSLENIKMIIK